MEFTELVRDDEAVSPVIGVILMVAITVILAAVIGTFVLGLGDELDNNAPQASFTFDFDSSGTGTACSIKGSGTDGELTVTHDGGDKIAASQLSIVAGGGSNDWNSCSSSSITDVSAGDSANPVVKDEDTVRVVWESSNGGDTATLGKWTGPNA